MLKSRKILVFSISRGIVVKIYDFNGKRIYLATVFGKPEQNFGCLNQTLLPVCN